jgi:hypothetical protein
MKTEDLFPMRLNGVDVQARVLEQGDEIDDRTLCCLKVCRPTEEHFRLGTHQMLPASDIGCLVVDDSYWFYVRIESPKSREELTAAFSAAYRKEFEAVKEYEKSEDRAQYV